MNELFIYDLHAKLQALKKLRVQAGYTQQRIADLLGVDRSRVSIWERGKGYPEGATLILLVRIIDYMQVQLQRKAG
jgi:transcriptional regulator with XRE-family HTH domain